MRLQVTFCFNVDWNIIFFLSNPSSFKFDLKSNHKNSVIIMILTFKKMGIFYEYTNPRTFLIIVYLIFISSSLNQPGI